MIPFKQRKNSEKTGDWVVVWRRNPRIVDDATRATHSVSRSFASESLAKAYARDNYHNTAYSVVRVGRQAGRNW